MCVVRGERGCEHVLGWRDSDSNAYSDSDSDSHSHSSRGEEVEAMCVLFGFDWVNGIQLASLARLAAVCSLCLQIWVMWLIGKD